MIVADCEQRSPEWHQARLGVVSASEFHRILTPTGKASTQAETYMWRLVGEWLTGKPEEGYSNHWMDRGTTLEDEARSYFELQTGLDVKPVGFVYRDEAKLIGCSPDGLLDNGGLEIKAPSPGVHVRYLLRGGIPNDYIPQIQGGMWVTKADWWYFLSYHPEAPPALIKVNRDDKYIVLLESAINMFVEKMLEIRHEVIQRGFKAA